MKLLRYLTAATASVMVALAFALPSAANAQQPISIFIGSDSTFLPFAIADRKGFYKEEGLNITQRLFVTGAETMQSFRSLKGNFMASSAYAAMPLWHSDAADVVAIANFYSAPDNQKIISRPSIKTPADLKGKKIGTRKGSSAEYFLHTYLKKNGIELSSVKIIDLTPPEAIAAFAAGDVDAFVFWEPSPAIAMKSLGDKAAALSTARGYYVERVALGADRAFAMANPEVVEKVLRAVSKATDFINERPEEAIKIGSEVFRVDPSVVKVLTDQKPYTLAWDQAGADEYYRLAQFSVELGRFKTARPTSEIFDVRYLQKAVPGAVR